MRGWLLVLVLVGLFAGLVALGRWRAKRHLEAWLAFAERRGLTLIPGAWYSSHGTRISGTLGGVKVVIETFSESSGSRGDSTTTYTRVGGTSPAPISVDARVYREHVFSGLGKMLGFQDVLTGDATFDDALVVKADHEDEVRTLLSEPVRQALLDAPYPSQFRYDHGRIELRWAGTETDPAVLDRALDAVLAAGGVADTTADTPAAETDDEEPAPPRGRRRVRRKDAEQDA